VPAILWWVLGSIGALILLLLLWFGCRAFRFRRLQPIIFEYLALQDVKIALRYIDNHPQLLTADADEFIKVLLDRAWARGDAELFVFGSMRLALLTGCRKYGVETARQMAANNLQARFDAVSSPGWQRALAILSKLVTDGNTSIPVGEVDEELMEAMTQIMTLLRPLAANEETIANQDRILDGMHQILQQKADGTLLPFPDVRATSSSSTQARKRKRKRRYK